MWSESSQKKMPGFIASDQKFRSNRQHDDEDALSDLFLANSISRGDDSDEGVPTAKEKRPTRNLKRQLSVSKFKICVLS